MAKFTQHQIDLSTKILSKFWKEINSLGLSLQDRSDLSLFLAQAWDKSILNEKQISKLIDLMKDWIKNDSN